MSAVLPYINSASQGLKRQLPKGLIFSQQILSREQKSLLLESHLTDIGCEYIHSNACTLDLFKRMLSELSSHTRLFLVFNAVRVLFNERRGLIRKKKSRILKTIMISTLRSVCFTTLHNGLFRFTMCFLRRILGTNSGIAALAGGLAGSSILVEPSSRWEYLYQLIFPRWLESFKTYMEKRGYHTTAIPHFMVTCLILLRHLLWR
jgi:hypothetical protein